MPTQKEQIYDIRIEPLVTEILRICKENNIATIMDFSLGYEEDDEQNQLKVTSALLNDECDPSPEMYQAFHCLCPDYSTLKGTP